jgi:hypothetical protein
MVISKRRPWKSPTIAPGTEKDTASAGKLGHRVHYSNWIHSGYTVWLWAVVEASTWITFPTVFSHALVSFASTTGVEPPGPDARSDALQAADRYGARGLDGNDRQRGIPFVSAGDARRFEMDGVRHVLAVRVADEPPALRRVPADRPSALRRLPKGGR